MQDIKQRVTTFLTFSGQAKEAMDYYASFIPDTKVKQLRLFEENQGGIVGTVLNGTLDVMGVEIMFMDIDPKYAQPFSWATSLLIECQSEDEFDLLFEKLSKCGTIMMGPEPVMDLRKVAWVTDQFNVTWQLVWK